jgi:sterol desaturase/sphingolipid hydroxylase (fatty acid hydroxylase superfamily)
MTTPTLLTVLVTGAFLVLERAYPGRALPSAPGWYPRSLSINFAQLGITLLTGKLWIHLLGDRSLISLSVWQLPVAEGFVGWFIGTFIYYWWHRLRHRDPFWLIFHQIHHSPSRIEVLTSFYKHPVEIVTNSALSAVVLFPLLGCSLLGTFWYNFFAATGEYFYHANLRTPGWLRYFIQTPELHSIHHQYDVHAFNYSDIPLWDRMFGTYKDARDFVPRCGFPEDAESRLGSMLAFRDVYSEGYG